jgi:hypothetical protein
MQVADFSDVNAIFTDLAAMRKKRLTFVVQDLKSNLCIASIDAADSDPPRSTTSPNSRRFQHVPHPRPIR